MEHMWKQTVNGVDLKDYLTACNIIIKAKEITVNYPNVRININCVDKKRNRK